eukprot:evm.model.NODE_7645_length_6859_cov_20.414928.2
MKGARTGRRTQRRTKRGKRRRERQRDVPSIGRGGRKRKGMNARGGGGMLIGMGDRADGMGEGRAV